MVELERWAKPARIRARDAQAMDHIGLLLGWVLMEMKETQL